ncbi:MAG TPA: archaeosortase/exosortase family protein [Bacteroidales bacterium]|nr:archaeosortase/exosortase family protein [Bacteroidales bacterium]HNQ83475.1 archaeosortase/exosortase family protein [Bacteroidales bacterium]HOX77088.1 archaeosortase/exosortase family protein [Bacteroidales bacterium]HPM92322.1 archaeosortase/exosortase family protein [Bacteroidales bacterium]
MKKLYEGLNKSIKKYKLYVLKDVIIFIIITLAVHFTYRFWVNILDYWPVNPLMHRAHDFMSSVVYNQSSVIIGNILNIPFTEGENRFFYFENTGFIAINESCSGLKPMLQFLLLMIIFPGPWKHKAWFIPMGLVIVHLTNLFRISGLAVVTITLPEYWDFAHDNIFRPFFYVVIFLLWVWWAEKFRPRFAKRIKTENSG